LTSKDTNVKQQLQHQWLLLEEAARHAIKNLVSISDNSICIIHSTSFTCFFYMYITGISFACFSR